MENSSEAILEELRKCIIAVRSQLDEMEERLHMLEADMRTVPIPPVVEVQGEPVDFTSPVVGTEDAPQDDSRDVPREEPQDELSGESQDEIYGELNDETIQNEDMDIFRESVPAKAVIDIMAAEQTWRKDRPGSEVKDIRSAITLNDRVLFINSLFKEDAMLFQDTLTRLNEMSTIDEAFVFLSGKFPLWDFESELVYRFMMAVRRKLR